MPKDAQINLQGCLSSLEELQIGPDNAEYSTTYRNHLNLLKSMNTVLGNSKVTSTDADRVLSICLRYTTDVRCVPYVFSIISTLINIDKDKPLVDFLPFALAILEFLNTKCIENNTSNLRTLSFQVLMSHPKSTLIKLVRDHSLKLIETLGLFLRLKKAEDLDSKMESFTLLRMLEWLPTHEKALFVKEGISLWLASVVPSMIQILVTAEDDNKVEACLTYTEMLSKELVLQDYSDNPHWPTLLECIADSNKFPACIKALLEKGKDNWHRIWIVLLKLLKSQVTRNYNSYGSPINSILPIVESAFKKNSTQRVRAFACWNELIESLSHETVNGLGKRVKLVVIPLKLNNAKTEDTADAKFNTWWLFIQKFRPKIDKFTNEILIPFLHFMFGKYQTPKQAYQAIQLSHSLRKKCIEAFAEIMGHVDCSKCPITALTPLDGNITTTILLTDHWKDFVHALKTAVVEAAIIYNVEIKMNIRCIWNSFVLRLADMAENSLRQDMLDDLINMVSNIVSENTLCDNENLMEILVDDIGLPLLRGSKMKTLIKSKGQSHYPMHKIIKLIMGNAFDNYFKRFNSVELAELLQPLINTLVMESDKNPAYLICLLDELPMTNSALRMWTALAQASIESKLCLQVFNNILRWPFKTVHVSIDVKEAALAWYTLYNVLHVKLENTSFDNEISKVLTRPVEDNKATNYFVLFALIGVLKHKPDEEKMAKLEALTYEMNDYKDFEQLMPSLVDTVVLMLEDSYVNGDEILAQITINCVENILKVIKTETEASVSKSFMQSKDVSSGLRASIPAIQKTIISALKTYLAKSLNESIKKQVQSLLSLVDKIESPKKVCEPKKTKEFASPKTHELKKSKRKEASITNTVVENGEEYVVVKSNWKFNPKNLTEHQKEKLQRKRDIPALYQDLSQSQDEFKLNTWKTDSQDTSLSSSKSTTSNDVSETLKKITSTDIVPKIMENILDGDKQKNIILENNLSPASKEKTPKIDKLSTPTCTKSPRMALKDRVFRNVRNLIEKSSPQNRVAEKKEDAISHNGLNSSLPKTEIGNSKSPDIAAESNDQVSKTNNDDVLTNEKEEKVSPVTSPPDVRMNKMIVVTATKIDQNIKLVCTPVAKEQREINMSVSTSLTPGDRPTRMKRKPKKFDDSLLMALKKKRYSKNDSQSDSQDSQDSYTEITVAQVHTPNHKIKKNNDTILQTFAPTEVEVKEDAKNALTATDSDVMVLDGEISASCEAAADTDRKESYQKIEKISLISPTTPIDKPTDKSPEKPTTGEVPNSTSKASEGVDNIAAQNVTGDVIKEIPTVNTPLNKPRKLLRTTVKKIGAQNDAKIVNMETPSMSSKKGRKSKGQKEICVNDENAAVNTPISTISNLNKSKLLIVKKMILQTDTEKNDDKLELDPTPIKKAKKDNTISQLNSAKKCSFLRDNNENDKHSETVVTPVTKKVESSQNELSPKKDHEVEVKNYNSEDNVKLLNTPKSKIKEVIQKSNKKKSRIEKELMIDTVEGHPFLKAQSEKRLTRKKLMEVENSGKNIKMADKLNSKLESTPKTSKKHKERKTSPTTSIVTVEVSQDRAQSVSSEYETDEPPCSEDVIESSQDSTMTTISVKSTKKTPKRHPVVALKNMNIPTTPTQDLLLDCENNDTRDREGDETIKLQPVVALKKMDIPITPPKDLLPNREISVTRERESVKITKLQPVVALEKMNIPITPPKDLLQDCESILKPDKINHENTDIELPQNKTVVTDSNVIDLTENMDTEPIEETNVINLTENMDTEPLVGNTSDIFILTDTLPTITINSESEPVIGLETQELAEADTQPNDPKVFEQLEIYEKTNVLQPSCESCDTIEPIDTEHSGIRIRDTTEVSSPFKNDNQRKQDFLNNTVEISPIKVQSPDKEKKSPSPENSSDFVVIKLSSPVHSNGEPYEKQGSPEFFTEDKVSPDKRNASPPRVDVTVTNTSPSSSLSLKKNRPQVNRPSGRAAQMLGLLSVNSDLKITKLSEPEETKKTSVSAPARRNLRILYNSVGEGNDESIEQNVSEDSNFLKLKRTLPTVTSSPSGPILKRKHIDISDEATASPASKRKRVSFHDPPVSTTVSVHKYIEPISLMRSPQSSAKKRPERQTRSGIKSPKRLDNAFLESALSKTVESFTELTTPSDDTENISIDVTPIVEIVKTSELNDTDPICPDLIDCTDHIDVIASELSSPAMRDLFVKEIRREGKVETVGDLAKMTELQVNRLCIKAPKITVAKKVLTDYITNRPAIAVETVIEEAFSEPMTESLLHENKADVEMQTDEVEVYSKEVQTAVEMVVLAQTQTDIVVTSNTSIQTVESGSKATEDVIDSCISEREDFIEKLMEKLNDDQVKTIAEKLSPQSIFELILKKSNNSSTSQFNEPLKQQSKGCLCSAVSMAKESKSSVELTFVTDHLCERYESKDLILLCTQILHKVHDKPA